MEDMERRIGRGDLKQEKLDAIQVPLSFPIICYEGEADNLHGRPCAR